ncbi:hypothetical protein ABT169_17490 [Streptomyces sp. NPDC001616]|uniref:hypothetical protein n=1 Tax=Streptomyces sp. NPDC001616 TaxID=3156648 RepID=UPI00332DD031
MPTTDPAPGLPDPVTLIVCTACGTNHFTAGPNGRFHCSCGSTITPRDLELDPDERWCITPAGLLAYVTAPVVALRRYWTARAVMEDPRLWGFARAAHVEFRRALAELDAARAMGLLLPHNTPVEIGRVYLAAVINPDGTYSGGNPTALGWDCAVCAPRALDPSRQEYHPCRNPRGHAWSTVNGWKKRADRRDTHTYDVLSPIAPDLPTARVRAAGMLTRRQAAAVPA